MDNENTNKSEVNAESGITNVQRTEKKHCVMTNQGWIPDDYKNYVNESILNVNFETDAFQKQAFYFLSRGMSVFVSAHTSSGKTLVAEYAISLSQFHGTRTIYTSPIKALSNQKYHDFKMKYKDVGIVTGDVQVNPSAKCLVMTTEILRNMVYRNGDLLRDTEFVVFDEVHYINDSDRGVVWEECIIMLPKHISLIMLSATIPNGLEFSEWVGRTQSRTIYVISTNKRAVPLEHVLYSDWNVYAIEDETEKKRASNFKEGPMPLSKKAKIQARFKICDVANFIMKKRLVPAIFFCFSKKKCEEYAEILGPLNLNDEQSKGHVRAFLNEAIKCLSAEDRCLPQVVSMTSMVMNGIAVHHGSLLPFVKECVELLFSMNLVKILLATETFAMGVNMPAKCCVFLSLSKIDNGTFRYLSSGEYIQMSGRAGRRGMDAVGTVMIADPKLPNIEVIRRIIKGCPLSLSSQFKLSFGLILLSLRSNVKVEELMRRSYGEHRNQKNYDKDMNRLRELEAEDEVCVKCGDMMEYLCAIEEICSKNWKLICKSPILCKGTKLLLKDNSTCVVNSVNETTVTVDRCEEVEEYRENIEHGLSEGVTKHEPNGSAGSIGMLLYPISIRRPLNKNKVNVSEIFCVLKDGRSFWNYGLTNVTDVLEVKRLSEVCASLEGRHDGCEKMKQHYTEAITKMSNRREAEAIRTRYNISSLHMIDEYNKRMEFLAKRGFVDGTITLKGKAAAEIRTVNEVLVVEMIFSNEFEFMDGKKIISLMSSMVYEEALESPEEETLYNETKMIENYFFEMSKEMSDLGIPPFAALNFSLVDAVHEWCCGSSLSKIVSKYGVPEGSFVRLILRLEECCRELISVAVMIGDKDLEKKIEDASKSMKRDVIFLPSLYL
ncbi:hypothetical protein OCOL_001080 [Ordospora colligata]|uniref:Superfamily II RNA helicase n=1 Tax=Ordospora colligata OC4 TaxID=1354746 RepID=A0A0B2ULP6_9MICR|nr:superfamily II RNA helicase [Ordospora colligata OC4]KHN69977.1 superfamily II RNA helicase [Ordospora colligata OC4]TBU16147.1 superfamily II RNA helicase [Ordospora colligata]